MTSRPSSFRFNLMSWLPGTHNAVPACDIDITVLSVSTMRGPRSTRSPTKIAFRPAGCAQGRRRSARSRAAASSCSQLVATAVNVADDVERPVFVLAIVPQRLPLDDGRVDFLLRLEHVHVPEAFAPQAAKRPMQLAPLVANDVRTEVTIGSGSVPLVADALGQIQDDRDGEHVILARQRNERLARLGLDVRRIDDSQLGAGQASRGDEVQRRESVVR